MLGFINYLLPSSIQNYTNFGKVFSILLLVPLSITTAIYSHLIPKLLEIRKNKIINKLDYKLDLAIANSTSYFFILKRIRYFQNIILKYGYNSKAAQIAYKNIVNKHKLPFTVIIYNNRELAKVFSINNYYIPKEISTIFKDLFYVGKNFFKIQIKYHNTLLNLFGPGNRLEVLKERIGKLYRFTVPNKKAKGYYFIDEIDKIGFFFIIKKIPKFSHRISYVQEKLDDNIGISYIPKKIYIKPKNTSLNEFKIANERFIQENKSNFILNDKFWLFTKANNSIIWCISESCQKLYFYEKKLFEILYLLYILCFINIVIILSIYLELNFSNIIIKFLNNLSIKTQMSIIFSLATLVPLFISTLMGRIGIEDKKQILIEKVKTKLDANISNFENIFNKIINDFHITSLNIRNSKFVKELNLSQISNLVKKLKHKNKIQRIEIRDCQGNILFTTDHREIHGTLQATDIFSKAAIRKFAPNRILHLEEKISPEILMAEDYLNQDDMGVTSILRQPKKVIQFKLGTSPSLWYWDVYSEISSGPCFIGITHQLELLFEHYVKNFLKSITSNNSESESKIIPNILVINLSDTSSSLKTYPTIDKSKKLDSIFISTVRAKETNQIIFREFELYKNQKYWVLIKPEQVMNIYSFVSIAPIDAYISHISEDYKQLNLNVILSIIIAYLASTLITHLFIQPLNDLKKGIEAIKHRICNYKVPIRRNDELGNLAKLFNQVISEFKELEYGKVVQERLLPTKLPQIQGWDIFVYRIPATDLAGDYHDIIKIPNTPYIIFIIGDATGHGIPAALIMAMAKASITFQILDNWQFPEQTMENLNALFYKELKPRFKFMTLCYLVINTESGECIIDNAGHPYPIIVNYNKPNIRYISLPSLPLGARKTRKANPHKFTLYKNELLILYTDGVIECVNSKNQQFGYKKLEQTIISYILECKDISSEKISNVILSELSKHCNNIEFNNFQDDITLITIYRE